MSTNPRWGGHYFSPSIDYIDFVFRTVVGIRILYAMQTYLVEGTGATTAETGLQHAYTLRYYVTKYLI